MTTLNAAREDAGSRKALGSVRRSGLAFSEVWLESATNVKTAGFKALLRLRRFTASSLAAPFDDIQERKVTDLEITKLCAEAMGVAVEMGEHEWPIIIENKGFGTAFGAAEVYNPLHDDAQAMALVKKIGIDCTSPRQEHPSWWQASYGHSTIAYNLDLNRAICECVAKMQKEKSLAPSS